MGVMGSTIRGNPIRLKVKTSNLLVIASVSLVSVAVLALSWPRLQASFRYLPVDIAISRYHSDQQIPSDRLEVLIDFTHQAIAYHDNYRYHDGLSLLHYLRGLDVFTPALERREAYRQAAAEAMTSLLQAPAQPTAWLRLATLRWILHDEPETIIQPWKMSIFTGRTHSSLFAQRVEMGLAQREFMDQEAVAMLRDQLLLAWRARPGTLIRVLARRDRELVVTRALLASTDPEAVEEMEAWLEKLR
jgi:hypothetical protein